MFDSTTIPILEQVARFTETRQQLLASNVANLGVPGYRVRDLSIDGFQKALRGAIEARRRQHEPITSELTKLDTNDPLREVRDSIKGILYHDNSDVAMEQQVTEITKNQMMHNLALNIMRHQMRMLETAIGERI